MSTKVIKYYVVKHPFIVISAQHPDSFGAAPLYHHSRKKIDQRKMAQINSYLTFSGNCREAMTFYKECLGGQLMFQTVGGSPRSEKMPKKMKDCILHATLTKVDLILMGSDMVPTSGFTKGNSVSLCINCDSEEEIKTLYKALSKGGNANHPLEDTYWGALFGDLTDRFGNHWLLNYNRNSEQ
jgi:PhnB protein